MPALDQDMLRMQARRLENQIAVLLAIPFEEDEKAEWLLPIVAWLSKGGKIQLPEEAGLDPSSAGARLWLLIQCLKEKPGEAVRLGKVVRALLEETTALHLFCDAGMGGQRSFAGEALNRVSLLVLPTAPDDRKLDEVIGLLFPEKRTSRWLVTLPDALLAELWALIFTSRELPGQPNLPWHLLRADMADAVTVLAGRVASHGMENDVRTRCGPGELRASPFFTLPHFCHAAAELSRTTSDRDDPKVKETLEQIAQQLSSSRILLRRAVAHQEKNGVSVDLVHRLERMSRQLIRIEQLLRILFPESAETAAAGRRLFATLVSQTSDDRSLRMLVRSSLQQLSRKIVESASATGEHYIAATRSEYGAMLRGAAGAGLITAFTTFFKYSVADWKMPPFFLGLLSSLNYAGSFLLIYFLGWTLATKQPAATAATLASSMQNLSTEEDLERMVEQIARTTRSQLAAIAGNLCTVIPGAVLIDLAIHLVTGHHFFDEHHAEHALNSLHPLASLLVLYAALTGVLLWASSIVAGWFANWSSYRRLPEALARSRTLLRVLGPERRASMTTFVSRNIAGIAGNVVLGFFLGMAPFFGAFFGLPTEIRHVTLSSGLLAFGAIAYGANGVSQASFFWACLGIVIIGAFNFFVSFRLALWLAVRACDVEASAWANLRKALVREFLHSPSRFLLPPRADPVAAISAPQHE